MDFGLFLIVNAVLFIRPAELFPSLENWPIYNVVIVLNLIVAGPAIVNYLSENGLSRCPTTTCVLGVLACVVISHVARFDFWSARYGGLDFAKIVAYYLILVATVTTPRRLYMFLSVIVLYTLVVNGLSVLQYHGKIDMPALATLMEHDYDDFTGEVILIPRMRALGIFNDPNDLSVIIVMSLVICLAGAMYRPAGTKRLLLLVPVAFLLYALALTKSRGGFLALIGSGAVLFYFRYGIMRTAVLGSILLPAAVAFFGGRQSDIGGAILGGTGRSRAMLWSEGLQLFKYSPVFGIGQGRYADEVGQVAHNSFMHAFTELGFFGGMMFLGVFASVLWPLWRLHRAKMDRSDEPFAYALPYITALTVGFCISIMALSRNYIVPTYLVAGVGAVYLRQFPGREQVEPLRFDSPLLGRLATASAGFIAFVYFYIKFLYRLG